MLHKFKRRRYFLNYRLCWIIVLNYNPKHLAVFGYFAVIETIFSARQIVAGAELDFGPLCGVCNRRLGFSNGQDLSENLICGGKPQVKLVEVAESRGNMGYNTAEVLAGKNDGGQNGAKYSKGFWARLERVVVNGQGWQMDHTALSIWNTNFI